MLQERVLQHYMYLIHKYLDEVFHWYICQNHLIQRYTALKKMNLLKIDFQLKNRQ